MMSIAIFIIMPCKGSRVAGRHAAWALLAGWSCLGGIGVGLLLLLSSSPVSPTYMGVQAGTSHAASRACFCLRTRASCSAWIDKSAREHSSRHLR